MHMRPSDPSPHVRGGRAAPRIASLLACLCTMLALSTASSQAQTKLDVRKLLAEHLQSAAPFAAFDTKAQVAAASIRDTDPVPIPGGLAPGVHIFSPGLLVSGFKASMWN
jgi:hypothetical protein